MEDISKIFDEIKDSKNSIISKDKNSIRSTLFGTFYEGIIAKWFVEKEGYIHREGRPCVYWNQIEELKSTDDLSNNLNKSLLDKKLHGKHSNSDGLFERDEKYYLWEAKNWPKWREGKTFVKQVQDVLGDSPWLLAKKVKFKSEEKAIDGFLFSWWKQFDTYEEIEKQIEKITGLPFKFYFTSDIINECRREKYVWYKELVNEQKENIEEFFQILLE